jgi:hypothetical protein
LRIGEEVSPSEGEKPTAPNAWKSRGTGAVEDGKRELRKRPRPDLNRRISVLQTLYGSM